MDIMNKLRISDHFELFCSLVSLVVLNLPLKADDPNSNLALSTGFNRVITVSKLLVYSCLALQIHSSA